MKKRRTMEGRVAHAAGCLLGQLAGDSLGSLVEFRSVEEIYERYPDGVRLLADGGTWSTIAGQPTDDSEMALALARTLLEHGTYAPHAVREAYRAWLDSNPFDVGMTIFSGLRDIPNRESQANGALMRISPLGIFGAVCPAEQVAEWARKDADITHPNQVCVDINALFAMAIAHAVNSCVAPHELYEIIETWATDMQVEAAVQDAIRGARNAPPPDYTTNQGWVLISFQNALWQLLHAATLEEGVIDTVMRGGDTDTNAAICGALLGAVYGRNAIPSQWEEVVLACRPEDGKPKVLRPRPPIYWPVDAIELAEELVAGPPRRQANS